MNTHFRPQVFLLWLTLFLCSFVSRSYALSTDWLINPQQPEAKVQLILSGEINPQDKTVTAALDVKLSGEWKTYWRSPGDAGIPPVIDWKIDSPNGSKNLESVEWLWPLPHRIELLGLHTLGYKNGAVFPLILKVHDLNQPVALNGRLRLSSCTTICVLTDYDIQLDFTPSQLKSDTNASFRIDRALSTVPALMPDTGISAEKAVFDPVTKQLEIAAQSTAGWNEKTDVIIDGLEDISFSLPAVRTDGSQLNATVDVSSWLGEFELKDKNLTITLINGNNASEQSINVIEGIVSSEEVTSASLILMLGFALLGGLILNLMPCVLPVLGMKLSSVVQAAGQKRSKTRQQFLASAAGIIFSFWILAGFLFILKITGGSIGWGIQFQNPWFIGFMVAITALFAANLLEVFEIRLPSFMSTKVAEAGDDSVAGHFVQGMFATLLATPCSAPFLGTAVAFALSSSSFELFLIFTALGLGLSLPYILIAARPSLLKWMPKPGMWMVNLRRVLALMLIATMLWLFSLLKAFVDIQWLALVMLFVSTLLFTAIVIRFKPNWSKAKAVSLALALALSSVALTGWLTGSLPRNQQQKEVLNWQPLNQAQIATLVNEGKTVFVDVTADWCVTCKANKLAVIDNDPVQTLLQKDNIILMKGDWTRPSDEISAFLQKYGRFGVPFNIVYGPDAPKGLPLPVILSSDSVVNAVNKVSSQ
ncbi:cytochrome C biogenesis protein [Endozoicomonas sp. OPT23]|uniref:protein-disulfide reductase DsbD family protein n=1 Tax=Endozoicomonas sp. OPT23 TaxID=2072845 RepID=UPI00129B3B45|nr:thioredoxin family protein [Endozoicomonas sp. OPT23]MRI31873.1 cytochrome C biogenesis protein [Endozoicomonas sp. OPT23]